MIIICILGLALRARKDQKSPKKKKNADLLVNVPVSWHCPNYTGFHVLIHSSCKENNPLECLSHSEFTAWQWWLQMWAGFTTHVS